MLGRGVEGGGQMLGRGVEGGGRCLGEGLREGGQMFDLLLETTNTSIHRETTVCNCSSNEL